MDSELLLVVFCITPYQSIFLLCINMRSVSTSFNLKFYFINASLNAKISFNPMVRLWSGDSNYL